MQPSLGGTLKAYRLQKGLSQTELSAVMGWTASPGRLSRYEQGRILPSRATLDRLSEVLGLAPNERGSLLMQAGCVPTDGEVAQALRGLQPFMDGWKGPAYLADFTWRFLGWNKIALMIFGFPPDEVERLRHEKPTLLELAFDSRWAPRRHIPDDIIVPFGRGQIARFKAQQRLYAGQRWHRRLVKRLLADPLFRELWHTTSEDLGSDLMEYHRVQMDTPAGRTDFHMFASALVADPRLTAMLWLPADEATARLLP